MLAGCGRRTARSKFSLRCVKHPPKTLERKNQKREHSSHLAASATGSPLPDAGPTRRFQSRARFHGAIRAPFRGPVMHTKRRHSDRGAGRHTRTDNGQRDAARSWHIARLPKCRVPGELAWTIASLAHPPAPTAIIKFDAFTTPQPVKKGRKNRGFRGGVAGAVQTSSHVPVRAPPIE